MSDTTSDTPDTNIWDPGDPPVATETIEIDPVDTDIVAAPEMPDGVIVPPMAPEGSVSDQQDLITFAAFRGLTPNMRKGLSNYLRRNGFSPDADGFNEVRAKLQGDSPVPPSDADAYDHLRYLDRHRVNDERSVRVTEANATLRLQRENAEMQQPTQRQMAFLADSVGEMKSLERPEGTKDRVWESFQSLIEDVELAPIVGLNRHQAGLLTDRIIGAGNMLGFQVRKPQAADDPEMTAEEVAFANGVVGPTATDEEPF